MAIQSRPWAFVQLRGWLFSAAAFVVGYLIDGPVLGGLFFGLAFAVERLWSRMKRAAQAKVDATPDSRRAQVPRFVFALGLSSVVLVGMLLLYPAVVVLVGFVSPGTIKGWLSLWEPVPSFLSAYIPALNEAARALEKLGYVERATLIQHMLSFGWIVAALTTAAALALVWTQRKTWPGLPASINADMGPMTSILGSLLMIGLIIWLLWFGYGFGGRRATGLITLDLFLPVLTGIFFLIPASFALAASAVLTRTRWGSGPNQRQRIQTGHHSS